MDPVCLEWKLAATLAYCRKYSTHTVPTCLVCDDSDVEFVHHFSVQLCFSLQLPRFSIKVQPAMFISFQLKPNTQGPQTGLVHNFTVSTVWLLLNNPCSIYLFLLSPSKAFWKMNDRLYLVDFHVCILNLFIFFLQTIGSDILLNSTNPL